MAKSRHWFVAANALAALLFFERELHAYTDPGSGALIWQLLVGVFFGATYVIRKLVARITGRGALGSK